MGSAHGFLDCKFVTAVPGSRNKIMAHHPRILLPILGKYAPDSILRRSMLFLEGVNKGGGGGGDLHGIYKGFEEQ